MACKQCNLLYEIKDADGKVTQAGCVITRNALNAIISIRVQAQLEDTVLVDKKNFDFLIEGNELASIQGDIATGVQDILKTKAKTYYDDWQKDLAKTVATVTTLDTAKGITDNFGVDKITKI